MNDTKFSGLSDWRKPLRRSLLLLAAPMLSAIYLSFGGTTIVGHYVHRLIPLPISLHPNESPSAFWAMQRTAGQFIVLERNWTTYGAKKKEKDGLVVSLTQHWDTVYRGLWAPTRLYHEESWKHEEFVQSESDPSEYWPAVVEYYEAVELKNNKIIDVVQSFIDAAVVQAPDRPDGLVEVSRGTMGRGYAKETLLLSGYIHNTIVLLCAAAGLFELARAVKGLVRPR